MRILAALAATAAIVLQAPTASAQGQYPNKAIRLVVPFAAGGNTDIMARLIGAKMAEYLGQQVIIDNRGGAGGNIGADLVAKSPPDGYTLLMATVATHALNAALYTKMPYDPVTDFEPISLLAVVPQLLVIHPSLKATTVQEFVSLLKAEPGKYSYGSSGNGTPLHLAGELFKSLGKVEMGHVPYRGSGPALTDLMSGQIQVMFDLIPSVMPHVKAGTVRALAITSLKRSAVMPDMPTVAESGLAGYETYTWNALFAPAKTPRAIIDRLNAEANKAVAQPDVRQKMIDNSAEPIGTTPEQLAEHVKAELAKWTPIVKASGAKVD
jgi:tripartite-type tricarboxylate transporter receptor subunit TctC